jgi:hypothetical protein
MRVEVIDQATMQLGDPTIFVTGVDLLAWDVLPDGSGVIAVERRPDPVLRLVLDATPLFEPRSPE